MSGRSAPFSATGQSFPPSRFRLFCCVLCTGQNSLLSAALFGAAAVTLDRSPTLAGILIGCVAYKPQLAVLAPLALATAGRWRAFVTAAGTVVVLVGASIVAFDTKTWIAFFKALTAARDWNANGLPGFDKFASPYAAMRLLAHPSQSPGRSRP